MLLCMPPSCVNASYSSLAAHHALSFLSSDGATVTCTAAPELDSMHEEDNTCLFLHAAHAATAGYRHIVLKSPDTDVAVLACCFSYNIQAHIYFFTGVK